MNTGDSQNIAQIIKENMPAEQVHTGVEIGVHRGETTAELLRTFPPSPTVPGLVMVMVDPWGTYEEDHPYYKSGDGCARFTYEQQQENKAAALKNTAFARPRRIVLATMSKVAFSLWKAPRISFVFIDGDHTYEAVKQDIELWRTRVQPGGLICGHDIGHPRDVSGIWGITKAVTEAFGDNYETRGSIWYTKQPFPEKVLPHSGN